MILGIGTDIVEVARIERMIKEQPRFLERILTAKERTEVLSVIRIAGRWAAKEAIYKAVDFNPTWQDIEIENDAHGQPLAVVLSGQMRPNSRLFLSISHERSHAVATALYEELVATPADVLESENA